MFIAEGQIQKKSSSVPLQRGDSVGFCPRVGVNPGFGRGCRPLGWEEGKPDNDSHVQRLLMKGNFVYEASNRKLEELEM